MNGIQGNDAAQARVFAHDAVNIVVGAINWSATNGGLEITTAGTGYALEDEITLAAGSGTSAKFLVKAINSAGGVTRLEQKPISAPLTYESGAGYALASTPAASGGSGSSLAVKVVDIDIPNIWSNDSVNQTIELSFEKGMFGAILNTSVYNAVDELRYPQRSIT